MPQVRKSSIGSDSSNGCNLHGSQSKTKPKCFVREKLWLDNGVRYPQSKQNLFSKSPMRDDMVDCETARIVFQTRPGFLLEALQNTSKNRGAWLRSIPPGATSFMKIFLNLFQEGCARSIF